MFKDQPYEQKPKDNFWHFESESYRDFGETVPWSFHVSDLQGRALEKCTVTPETHVYGYFFGYLTFMERFHSRDQQPYWITETKESVCIKIEFNSRRISLVYVHHHGRHFVMSRHVN